MRIKKYFRWVMLLLLVMCCNSCWFLLISVGLWNLML